MTACGRHFDGQTLNLEDGGENPGMVEAGEGIRRRAKRGAAREVTAFGRHFDGQTLNLKDGGENPGRVVTLEGFEPSIFALKV